MLMCCICRRRISTQTGWRRQIVLVLPLLVLPLLLPPPLMLLICGRDVAIREEILHEADEACVHVQFSRAKHRPRARTAAAEAEAVSDSAMAAAAVCTPEEATAAAAACHPEAAIVAAAAGPGKLWHLKLSSFTFLHIRVASSAGHAVWATETERTKPRTPGPREC